MITWKVFKYTGKVIKQISKGLLCLWNCCLSSIKCLWFFWGSKVHERNERPKSFKKGVLCFCIWSIYVQLILWHVRDTGSDRPLAGFLWAICLCISKKKRYNKHQNLIKLFRTWPILRRLTYIYQTLWNHDLVKPSKLCYVRWTWCCPVSKLCHY